MGSSGLQAHPNAMEVAPVTTPSEDYRLIPLTQGQFAKVDAADYDWLMQFSWHARFDPTVGSFYAQHSFVVSGRKRNTVKMHRFILGASGSDVLVDHKNHDTLDNRRENIRAVSPSQSSMNRKLRSDTKSGFKGVTFHKITNRYQARIVVGGRRISLGYRKTAEEAHQLYVAASAELHGEFGRTK